jgi:hypothetical protein
MYPCKMVNNCIKLNPKKVNKDKLFEFFDLNKFIPCGTNNNAFKKTEIPNIICIISNIIFSIIRLPK